MEDIRRNRPLVGLFFMQEFYEIPKILYENKKLIFYIEKMSFYIKKKVQSKKSDILKSSQT